MEESAERGIALRDQLKVQLKRKSMTYRNLAEKIGVSEVTIKRWLTSHDISLANLLKVCDVVGIHPVQLVELDPKEEGYGHAYTEEQENHFSQNPRDQVIFVKALVGFPFEEIRSRTGASTSELLRSLRKLEKIGILKLLPGNRIKMVVRGPFRWRDKGSLSRHWFQKFRETLYAHFRKFENTIDRPGQADAQDCSLFRPFELYLEPSQARQMTFELSEVLLKYRMIAFRGSRNWKALKPISGLIAVDSFDAWQKCQW